MDVPSISQDRRAQRLFFWMRRPPGGEGVHRPLSGPLRGVAFYHGGVPWSFQTQGRQTLSPGCPGNLGRMSRSFGGLRKVCPKERLCSFSAPKSRAKKAHKHKGMPWKSPVRVQLFMWGFFSWKLSEKRHRLTKKLGPSDLYVGGPFDSLPSILYYHWGQKYYITLRYCFESISPIMYHSTENHYIISRYFPELILSDVM